MTRTILSVIAALLLCAAVLLGLAATTQPGLRWLFAAVAQVMPGQLSAAQVHGTLLGPMRVEGLRYAHDGNVTKIGQLKVRWRASALWHRTLYLDEVHIQGLHASYQSGGKGTTTLPNISLPLRVVLADLRIEDAVVQRPGAAEPLAVSEIELAARVDAHRLAVSRLSIDAKRFSVNLSGELTPKGNYPLAVQLHWRLKASGKRPELAGKGTLGGSVRHLEMHQTLQTPSAARLELHVDTPLTDLHWRSKLDLPSVAAHTINPAWPAMQVSLHAQASGTRERFAGTASYTASRTPAGDLGGHLQISGTRDGRLQLQRLSVKGKGSNPFGITLTGSADIPARKVSLHGQWHDLVWPPAGQAKARSPKGELTLNGTLAHYRFKAGGGLVVKRQAPIEWHLQGSGDRGGAQIDEAQASLLGGEVRAAGSLRWAGGAHFDLDGSWHDLRWSAETGSALHSPQGRYTLRGSPGDYTLTVHGNVAGKAIPAAQIALDADGSQEALHIGKLDVEVLGGHIQGRGRIAWVPQLRWDLALDGQGLDPGSHWPEWPGKLALQARTSGTLQEGQPQGNAELVKLDGTLRGYPVAAAARVTISGTRYTVENLKLHSGRSSLSAKGSLGEQMALSWNVDSPDLRELLPGAKGSLKAYGAVQGKRSAPAITASLTAHSPAYTTLGADSLKAKIKLALAGNGEFSVGLKANGLHYKNKDMGSLAIDSTGTAARHRIQVSLQGPGPTLALSAKGTLAQGAWDGRLESSSLAAAPFGKWSQAQPIAIKLSRSALSLSHGCWQRQQAQLCLAGDWKRGADWHLQTSLSGLPSAWVGDWLALPATLSSTLQGQASAVGRGRSVRRAKVRFTAGAGALTFTPQAGSRQTTVKHGELKVRLDADANATSAALGVELTAPAHSKLDASLHLPPLRLDRGYLAQAPLEGRLSATVKDLKVVEAFVPNLADVSGNAHADLQLSGTLDRPQLKGQAAIEKAAAKVPRLGISLKDISLQAESGANQIKLTGTASSGPGKINLSGHLGLGAAQGWPLELSIKGERFEAANIPEAWVLASPDLKITAAHHAVNLTGQVTIPEAKLHPRQIVAAVPVSSDVEIVSGKQSEAKAQRWKVTSKVRVTLGDKVSLKAYGFSGRITGSVVAHDQPGKPTTGSGQLEIKDGSYTAYGQKLQIESGRVVFAGGRITDPGLNLRAVRTVGDVTAGVRVQGRVSSPQLTLFSDPSMSQDNILSYLIIGQPLDQATNSQGQLLARAASSLALQGGNLLSKRIGQTFGLSNVGIESSGTPQSASLVIGKYLSPRLYVSYGMGLFQSLNTFRMRYKLGKHWSVEAETGSQTGADVLYSR